MNGIDFFHHFLLSQWLHYSTSAEKEQGKDGDAEILLTILSSLSQEEARSISENVTWGLRKKFADGKFSVGYSHFLGYDKGEDGNLAINEEQAKIVRLIFQLFLEGMTADRIAKNLTARHILTVTGKEKWNAKTIRGILSNEKYTGCASVEMTEKCIRENARIAQSQEEYQRSYEGLVVRYDVAKARFDEVLETISAKEAQSEQLAVFIKRLKNRTEPVAEFDSQLWAGMVECVTVGVDKGLTVVFRDGTAVRV